MKDNKQQTIKSSNAIANQVVQKKHGGRSFPSVPVRQLKTEDEKEESPAFTDSPASTEDEKSGAADAVSPAREIQASAIDSSTGTGLADEGKSSATDSASVSQAPVNRPFNTETAGLTEYTDENKDGAAKYQNEIEGEDIKD